MLGSLRLAWHRWSTRRKMERVFSRREDPFRYREDPYEKRRLDAMEAALAGRFYQRALEVGCAEGLFTRRLLPKAARVTALDVSAAALARARAALGGEERLALIEADVRAWEPPQGTRFDLVVLADVLYYLDKPLVRDAFAGLFPRLRSWLSPDGTLLLAHAFAGPAEKAGRRGYRERFEALGLKLEFESVVGEGEPRGEVCCLVSLLKAP